jgi:hypothetical protein
MRVASFFVVVLLIFATRCFPASAASIVEGLAKSNCGKFDSSTASKLADHASKCLNEMYRSQYEHLTLPANCTILLSDYRRFVTLGNGGTLPSTYRDPDCKTLTNSVGELEAGLNREIYDRKSRKATDARIVGGIQSFFILAAVAVIGAFFGNRPPKNLINSLRFFVLRGRVKGGTTWSETEVYGGGGYIDHTGGTIHAVHSVVNAQHSFFMQTDDRDIPIRVDAHLFSTHEGHVIDAIFADGFNSPVMGLWNRSTQRWYRFPAPGSVVATMTQSWSISWPYPLLVMVAAVLCISFVQTSVFTATSQDASFLFGSEILVISIEWVVMFVIGTAIKRSRRSKAITKAVIARTQEAIEAIRDGNQQLGTRREKILV